MRPILNFKKRFANLKIRQKMFATFTILFLLVLAIFITYSYILQRQEVNREFQLHTTYDLRIFNNTRDNETRILASLLGMLTSDSSLMATYKKGNRSEIYNYTRPILDSLKASHNITSWKFITPDNKVFLRVEDLALSGDDVNSEVLKTAVARNQVATGFELDKTNFALKAIVPWRDSASGDLIAYIEIAEDINPFLSRVEQITGAKFVVGSPKANINQEDFIDNRRHSSERNNWGDMDSFVFLSANNDQAGDELCFNENNLKTLQSGKFKSNLVGIDNSTYACAGFNLPAPNNNSYYVMYLADLSSAQDLFINSMMIISILLMITFILVIISIFTLAQLLSQPLKNLVDTINMISAGDTSRRSAINSEDEIGELAQSFNSMADILTKQQTELRQKSGALKEANDQLEKKVAERTKELELERQSLQKRVAERTAELSNVNRDLENKVTVRTAELQKRMEELSRFNKIAVDRELKMIELKKEIADLRQNNSAV